MLAEMVLLAVVSSLIMIDLKAFSLPRMELRPLISPPLRFSLERIKCLYIFRRRIRRNAHEGSCQ